MDYQDIQKYLVPGTIVYLDGKSFISNAIQKCQTIYTKKKFGKKSMWSHVLWVGNDDKTHESTFGKSNWSIMDGITHMDVEKRFSKKYIHENTKIGFQNLKNLTESDIREITQWFHDNTNIKYGKIELFGVLKVLAKWRWYKLTRQNKKAEALLTKENPVNKTDQVVCIAAVADAIHSIGKKFIGVESSVATVDEGWLGVKVADVKKIVTVK